MVRKMAHPIESTVLSNKDFDRLVEDLKNPKPNPAAREMYERGREIHSTLHR